MNLEESINNLKKLVELRKNKSSVKHDTCICGTKDLETVLQEIKRLQKKHEILVLRTIEYDKTLEKLRKDSISKEKTKNKIREQIEEADEVLVGKEYIDNFEGNEENQEYYYKGYKDASLFIRDTLED